MDESPWLSPDTPWKTEAAFYNYIRGGLRKALWAKNPIKLSYLSKNRFKAPIGKATKSNPKGMVWACVCEICGETFRQNECEVDHKHPAGRLSSPEDLQGFITRLAFVSEDDLRILDKECHRIVSYAEKQGISFEEAKREKQAIAFSKLPVAEQKAWCQEHTPDAPCGNNTQRRRAFRAWLDTQ